MKSSNPSSACVETVSQHTYTPCTYIYTQFCLTQLHKSSWSGSGECIYWSFSQISLLRLEVRIPHTGTADADRFKGCWNRWKNREGPYENKSTGAPSLGLGVAGSREMLELSTREGLARRGTTRRIWPRLEERCHVQEGLPGTQLTATGITHLQLLEHKFKLPAGLWPRVSGGRSWEHCHWIDTGGSKGLVTYLSHSCVKGAGGGGNQESFAPPYTPCIWRHTGTHSCFICCIWKGSLLSPIPCKTHMLILKIPRQFWIKPPNRTLSPRRAHMSFPDIETSRPPLVLLFEAYARERSPGEQVEESPPPLVQA